MQHFFIPFILKPNLILNINQLVQFVLKEVDLSNLFHNLDRVPHGHRLEELVGHFEEHGPIFSCIDLISDLIQNDFGLFNFLIRKGRHDAKRDQLELCTR